MRREYIAAVVAVLAITGVAIFSIAREKSMPNQADTSLVAVDGRETGSGNITPQTAYEGERTGSAPAYHPPSRVTGARTPSMSIGMVRVPAGTDVPVRLTSTISSEHASAGESWSGVVTRSVYAGGRVAIPAGTHVTGVVSGVSPARRGDRAMLDLALTSLHIGDQRYAVRGGTEAVVAGSPRARNLGAIAGGAAAGALLGRAVSGSSKGTIIGGVLGAATATGVVAKSKGFQVVLKEGTVMSFNLNQSVAISRRAVEDQLAYR